MYARVGHFEVFMELLCHGRRASGKWVQLARSAGWLTVWIGTLRVEINW